MALVAPGLRDDEPQVRVDHRVLRLEVATLDPLCQLDLFRGREQRVKASLAEEQLERVDGYGSVAVIACRGELGCAQVTSLQVSSATPPRPLGGVRRTHATFRVRRLLSTFVVSRWSLRLLPALSRPGFLY